MKHLKKAVGSSFIQNETEIYYESETGKYHYGIFSTGCDWVEVVFVNPSYNMITFAKELYEFCPDIVDQGTGNIESLV